MYQHLIIFSPLAIWCIPLSTFSHLSLFVPCSFLSPPPSCFLILFPFHLPLHILRSRDNGGESGLHSMMYPQCYGLCCCSAQSAMLAIMKPLNSTQAKIIWSLASWLFQFNIYHATHEDPDHKLRLYNCLFSDKL